MRKGICILAAVLGAIGAWSVPASTTDAAGPLLINGAGSALLNREQAVTIGSSLRDLPRGAALRAIATTASRSPQRRRHAA